MNPILKNSLKDNECILYVNYFGIFDSICDNLTSSFKTILFDCSQSFFYKPKKEFSAIYSPRKFYGLPDGGFLYTPKKINCNLKFSLSNNRFKHLLLNFELNESEAFKFYQLNEKKFKQEDIELMSKLTYSLLSAQNHNKTIKIRNNNFNIYHNALKNYNTISNLIKVKSFKCPVSYPFLTDNSQNLRKYLNENKVFTPIYWKSDDSKMSPKDCFMNKISESIIHLPLDQRYCSESITRVIDLINKYL